ncbi:uncharacterized protein LOC116214198 isoform X2 [Punica granatum]|uniref:Uncharacterized protein LOC116214198 isoform X2 n=1 Tax=Punica granatum TaxID=22663 RepID=A0A6P8EFY7_PUNGR|nr:uncharacterized protein LOC116214198 isoform X2 [Punica granatum]
MEGCFGRKAREATAADMDADRISSLPDEVKHHILSLIPNIKEVVKISSLSKSWLRTWRSFQITDFDQHLILPDESSDRFIRFVDDYLMRSHEMPRFRLSARATPEMAPHVDRWLGISLDYHVKELSVNIFKVRQIPGKFLYSIPARVLSAGFMKSLTLDGAVKIDGISTVNLPSLLSLHLSHSHIDNQMFRRLLGGCPFIEDLSVFCCSPLSEIKVLNLNHLKRMKMTSMRPDLKVVGIEAPGLERFCMTYYFETVHLTIHVSPSVRCLEFTGLYKTDEWFCQFLSELPLLESLTLNGCRLLERIWISNPLLKKILIMNCDDLLDITIDTPKLSSFSYEAETTLPSIWTKNHGLGCAVGFRFYFWREPTTLWFQELQNFLTEWSTAFRCPELTVHLYQRDEGLKDEVNKNVALSAPGILHLKLLVLGPPQSSYPLILDGLFSTCHPATFIVRARYPLLEFICEALANREENGDGSLGDVECWKHELKDVKIESFEGNQHGLPLDQGTIHGLLPVISTWNTVCFRMQWGD